MKIFELINKKKQNSAVTLVSLVVTIIILIILAGVSLNLTLGDHGLITIAKKARENTLLTQLEEEMRLNELYTQIETEGNSNYETITKLNDYKKAIAEAITKEKVETSSDADTQTMVDNIGKILQERTKDATLTEEYMAKGKTAYVNGEKIVGTGEKYDVLDLKGRFYLYKPDRYDADSR